MSEIIESRPLPNVTPLNLEVEDESGKELEEEAELAAEEEEEVAVEAGAIDGLVFDSEGKEHEWVNEKGNDE